MNENQSDRLRAAIGRLSGGKATEENHRLLFEHYRPVVRRFFTRMGISSEDGADLTQDVFFRVSTGRGSFKDEGHFRSWVLTIARNTLKNHQRDGRAQKRDGLEESLSGQSEETLHAASHHRRNSTLALDGLLAREAVVQLMEAITQLPPKMRQCMILRVVEEYSYQGIASLLKVSIETVKAQLHEGRRRLRQQLSRRPLSAE